MAVLAGCGDRGAVTFDIKVPSNTLFNPIAQSDLVTEFDIRTASGTLLGVASAVHGSASGDSGALPLGPLGVSAQPEDVYVTALSGGSVLGEARVRQVSIKGGSKVRYEAEMRKPLLFVGSALPVETASGNKVTAVKILDPNQSVDLAKTPPSSGNPTPTVAGGMTAGAVSWDGRFLFAANGTQLSVFDTGLGMNVGSTLTLPFAPTRMAVVATQPKAQVLVALDPGSGGNGSLALLDVDALEANAATTPINRVQLPGQIARTVAFSPDGSKIYVLTGGTSADPCSPAMPRPPSNAIVVVGSDGTVGGTYTLPSFIGDIAIDPASGKLALADSTGNQISLLDLSQNPQPGNVTPALLLKNVTCPSAVRVVNGVAFAVTSDRDPSQDNAFLLQRVTVATGQSTALSLGGPSYQVPGESTASPDGNVQVINLPVRPAAIEAYEMSITPDGNRAEIATRADYYESNQKFMLDAGPCTANFEIVEYGLYTVDVHTGNAAYEMRSQVVTTGQMCIECDPTSANPLGGFIPCKSTPGDRPAGLAAAFGQ